ncbi:hypothetical protein [Bacillus sp. AFS040349]|uniref:hypothetical protein n=1 Tax=Bacillus sp. AFS040349 TaxID=2033502 RepID=UPI000BFC5265|nr:hypothetical protein [Bacillus sp. AFS040349]PGT82212.1 hypothetical protein COD11_15565 [Bacillus sp. AFS040349]
MRKHTHPSIRDLFIIHPEEENSGLFSSEYTCYFSEKMLADGIFIEIFDIANEEMIGTREYIESYINVKYLSEEDAETFTLYQDIPLSPIQLYSLLKDIKELYEQNFKNDFLKIMKDFSITVLSSSNQSNPGHKLELRIALIEEINSIKSAM